MFRNRYLNWLWGLAYWDGALPLFVLLVPTLVQFVLGRGHIAEVFVAVFVPIFGFVIRAKAGLIRLVDLSANERPAWWRIFFFLPALFVLLLFDALSMALRFAGNVVGPEDWQVMGYFYLCYLAPMALAFFPTEPGENEAWSEELVAVPWAERVPVEGE